MFSFLLHPPPTRLILIPLLPSGTPVMTVIAWGGDGASGAGQRNLCPERFRPRVPLPPLRAVRAGRAHRRDRRRLAKARRDGFGANAKPVRTGHAQRNGRKQKSPA